MSSLFIFVCSYGCMKIYLNSALMYLTCAAVYSHMDLNNLITRQKILAEYSLSIFYGIERQQK